MSNYKDSNGNKYSKAEIDRMVRDAKEKKIGSFIDEHGYIFCEDCGRSGGVRFDCSHQIGVDRCQKEGRSKLAWDIDNIKIRCRKCHQKHDKL
ncbi:MAG: hypothetical protein ACOCUT_01475 [bacterium]